MLLCVWCFSVKTVAVGSRVPEQGSLTLRFPRSPSWVQGHSLTPVTTGVVTPDVTTLELSGQGLVLNSILKSTDRRLDQEVEITVKTFDGLQGNYLKKVRIQLVPSKVNERWFCRLTMSLLHSFWSLHSLQTTTPIYNPHGARRVTIVLYFLLYFF